MDPRARAEGEAAPTHCAYSKCQEGPDGGPAPIAQTPGKRARYYCCDAHRVLAHQEGARRGRVAVLPTPPARQVVYGEDVVTAHREFRASLEALKAMAEEMTRALVPAADVRAAKAAVDQAEAALGARERQRLAELSAEIEARIAAVDRAESAEEAAAAAREAAEQAQSRQLEAERQLVEALAEMERDRETLRAQVERFRVASEEAVAAANARASEAEAAQEKSLADARAEIEQVQKAVELSIREARELAARAEGAREAAIAEAARAHDDARRAREDAERVRTQLEEQIEQERERSESRLAELRASGEARVSALERELGLAHDEARRSREDAERVRTQLERQLQQEQERAEARIVEVRESAAVRVNALERELEAARSLAQHVEQLAVERAQERDRLTRELDDVRSQGTEIERVGPTKRARPPSKKDKEP